MMGRARQALRQGRRDLHREMSVPALYIASTGVTPLPCTVRPHDKQEAHGALAGSSVNGAAQIQDIAPRLIFMTDDAPAHIRRGAIVSVEAGEAYRIELVQPQHGVTITAEVVRLTAADAAGLPLPNGSVPPLAPSSPAVEYVRDLTGHGVYRNTAAPQMIAADTPTVLVNNRGITDETQKPSDIVTFYDGARITGRDGDGLAGEILFTFTPADGTASWLTVYLRGTNGRIIFPLTTMLPGGSGFVHRLSHDFSAYNRATWAAGGVEVVIESDGPGTIGEVQYVLHRLHKARIA